MHPSTNHTMSFCCGKPQVIDIHREASQGDVRIYRHRFDRHINDFLFFDVTTGKCSDCNFEFTMLARSRCHWWRQSFPLFLANKSVTRTRARIAFAFYTLICARSPAIVHFGASMLLLFSLRPALPIALFLSFYCYACASDLLIPFSWWATAHVRFAYNRTVYIHPLAMPPRILNENERKS